MCAGRVGCDDDCASLGFALAAIAGEKLSAKDTGLVVQKHENRFLARFMWFSHKVKIVTVSDPFTHFVTFVILVAAVLVGMSAEGHDSPYASACTHTPRGHARTAWQPRSGRSVGIRWPSGQSVGICSRSVK